MSSDIVDQNESSPLNTPLQPIHLSTFEGSYVRRSNVNAMYREQSWCNRFITKSLNEIFPIDLWFLIHPIWTFAVHLLTWFGQRSDDIPRTEDDFLLLRLKYFFCGIDPNEGRCSYNWILAYPTESIFPIGSLHNKWSVSWEESQDCNFKFIF